MSLEFNQFDEYFGCSINSDLHKKLLLTLSIPADAQITIVTYKPATEYHCYYDLGIALMFENKLLDSIEFYKPDPVTQSSSKYKPVDAKRVPKSIGFHTTGKQLVAKLGEPLEKGGGSKAHIDIWMRWKGIQADLAIRDWEAAKDTEWCSLVFFKE